MIRTSILIALMAFVCFNINAQDRDATADRTTFGLRVGFDLQNINGKDAAGDNLEYSLVPRFNAGINVAIPVAPDFFLQPGLLFTTKGAKEERTFPIVGDFTRTINLSYLELPVDFLYKPVLGTGRFIVGFGPYIGYGIGGKVTRETGSTTQEQDVVYQNEVSNADMNNAYFRPLDYGINITAGYQFMNNFSLQLNTQWGIADIYPEHEGVNNDKGKMSNTGFGISAGYRF